MERLMRVVKVCCERLTPIVLIMMVAILLGFLGEGNRESATMSDDVIRAYLRQAGVMPNNEFRSTGGNAPVASTIEASQHVDLQLSR